MREVCDTPDEETEKLASILCDDDGEFKYEVLERLEHLESGSSASASCLDHR